MSNALYTVICMLAGIVFLVLGFQQRAWLCPVTRAKARQRAAHRAAAGACFLLAFAWFALALWIGFQRADHIPVTAPPVRKKETPA